MQPSTFRRLLPESARSKSVQSLNPQVKAALVTCGFIPVDKALIDHAVDNGYCGLIGYFRISFLTSGDGVHDLLDVSTQHGTFAGVPQTPDLRLFGAFARRGIVCQESYSSER